MVITLVPRGLALNTELPSSFVFLPLHNGLLACKVIYTQVANIMFFLFEKTVVVWKHNGRRINFIVKYRKGQ